eukprot:COSAG06_NODE_25241_length_641_cov_1.828413_1_plen_59_part_10
MKWTIARPRAARCSTKFMRDAVSFSYLPAVLEIAGYAAISSVLRAEEEAQVQMNSLCHL